MKTFLTCLALVGVAALFGACAALPSKQDINKAVTAPGVDAAAVHIETAVAVLARSMQLGLDQPNNGVDEVRLAKAVRRAAEVLDDARVLFDARTGDPVLLLNAAFDAIGSAVPPGASPKIRFALVIARGAASVYGSNLVMTGPPSAPSERLKAARADADAAIVALLASLPPPES